METHLAVLNGVANRINSLGLLESDGVTPLPATQVMTTLIADDEAFPFTTNPDSTSSPTLPGITVSLLEEAETIEDGSFEDDDIGYPVLVMHYFASNQTLSIDPTPLTWRRLIRRAFHEKTLTTPDPNVKAFRCVVEYKPVLSMGLLQSQNLLVGALMIRCYVTDKRDKTVNED